MGILIVFGLVMMSSVSIAESFQVTGGEKNDFYFWRHFRSILFGVPLVLITLKFPLDTLRKLAIPILFAGILALIATLILGDSFNTAARSWINLGFISVQPVEFFKLVIIVFLSALFASSKNRAGSLYGGLIPFAVVVGIPGILIMAQPDFGSLMVLMVLSGAIYFAAGARWQHIVAGIASFGLILTVAAFTQPYIMRRIQVFLDPSLEQLDAGFQVKQALIAIGSGGFWGRGFQNSIQKYDYLPEVQSDTIFAAIGEEMGFLRLIFLVGIYLFIAFRGMRIAQYAQDQFQQLMAVGLTTWIVGQAFLNIAVNLSLIPNTGITLPYVSYGGSSMWALLLASGLLLNISMHTTYAGTRRRYY